MATSIRIPDAILQELKLKYGTFNVKPICEDFIRAIINFTLTNGACSIVGLGKFRAFQSYSRRNNRYNPRFKFRASRSLLDNMAQDPFIMKRLEKAATVPFTEQNEEKCKKHRDLRDINAKVMDMGMRREVIDQAEAKSYIENLVLDRRLPEEDEMVDSIEEYFRGEGEDSDDE